MLFGSFLPFRCACAVADIMAAKVLGFAFFDHAGHLQLQLTVVGAESAEPFVGLECFAGL